MLIDTHCHLDVAEFDADRDAVLERAREAGVSQQIIPAIGRAGWDALRALCARHPGLHPAYGLHPMYLAEHEPSHLDDLKTWIEREKPCAIGECGLDLHVEGLDRDAQDRYFLAHLALARDHELPLVLHARRAVDAVTSALRRMGGLRGVVHSFSGSPEQAEQLWKLGFCIGIGGPVTYPRARRLREIVAGMPEEFLLLETDSPDQPMHGHQGRRNEPALLVEVMKTVAELRGESEDRIAELTTRNAARLFGLSLH
jgi:TatD DNase family protein